MRFCVVSSLSFVIDKLVIKNNILLAPMAGITDQPFRCLCNKWGAGVAYSEMLSTNPAVWKTPKSAHKIVFSDEESIRAIQIAGSDPDEMAVAARHYEKLGAQLIDINMGCPAKKVNKQFAGSALLKNPKLVAEILTKVVNSVSVPVTLKIRTGWNKENKNFSEIAQIAQECGIKAITIHGRTRECLFNGDAEYDSARMIKQIVTIPVIVNGDISTALKAKAVLDYTHADAIMIGRGAQGNPWIFNEIQHYLETGQLLQSPTIDVVFNTMIEHVKSLHQFYGLAKGFRIARKHVGWYLSHINDSDQFRCSFNAIDDANAQLVALEAYFKNLTLHN